MSDLGNKDIMANNIKRYMELQDKDRKQVCNDLGFKYSTFSEWINGNKYPRIDKIEIMANYFGITKADLVEQKNNEKNPPQDLKKILEGKNIKYNGRVMSEEEKKFVEKMLANMYYQAKELNDKKE